MAPNILVNYHEKIIDSQGIFELITIDEKIKEINFTQFYNEIFGKDKKNESDE